MSRHLEIIVTDDAADLELLSLANEKGKFGLELGYTGADHIQYAFERGIDAGWFTFVDLSRHNTVPGGFLRIFKLTEKGLARRIELISRLGQ